MTAGPLLVLARGDDWLIVGKPSGLLVHRTAGVRERDAALQRARNLVKHHVNAVHRLDRAASGCLLFAMERERTRILQDALLAPATAKSYLALTRGRWRHGDGDRLVTTPIKMEDGSYKDGRTVVRCLGTTDAPRCSLVLARPLSGRFHQVRRHLRDLDHPILGDTVHGDSRVNRAWREERGLGRLALHALALALDVPADPPVSAFCPIPDDLSSVLHALPFWPDVTARWPALTTPWGDDPNHHALVATVPVLDPGAPEITKPPPSGP